MSNGVNIQPDIASASKNDDLGVEQGGEADPDYELDLRMQDRRISLFVSEGENIALNTPDGQIFAYLSVEEYTSPE